MCRFALRIASGDFDAISRASDIADANGSSATQVTTPSLSQPPNR